MTSSAAVTGVNVPTRVCRICEKKIKDFGTNIETHTQKCLSIQAIHDQCETINQEIITVRLSFYLLQHLNKRSTTFVISLFSHHDHRLFAC